MLKKTLLVVGAAMALVAFAVPVGAQGNQWYTDTGGPGGPKDLLGSTTNTGDQVTLTGELSTTAGPAFSFRSGPCKVDATATLWNSGGQATGEVTAYAIATPCPTSVPGCTVNSAGASTAFPWHVDITGDAIAITGVGFFIKYDDGCTVPLGIPPNVSLGGTGTATATFNTTTHCFDFNDSGHIVGPLGVIRTDGSLCPEPGNTLTLG